MNSAKHYELRHANVLDVEQGAIKNDCRVTIHGERISMVEPEGRGNSAPQQAKDVESFDASGLTVMPGLIDAHVHVLAVENDLGRSTTDSPYYVMARASKILEGMLRRGFTTVRDVGGADHGVARAVEQGLVSGPRVVYGGPAISQTGGHGDFREAGESHSPQSGSVTHIGSVHDGVASVRRAVREEIRKGASHIKLMLSGGIASPTDRIDSSQFSSEEIAAAVEEARNANIYVTGHAYTSDSIVRALELGVRCIEHGNLIDENAIASLLEHDAWLVPTLAIGRLQATSLGEKYGISARNRSKAEVALERGLESLTMAYDAGVNIGFGTDFIGRTQPLQLSEISLRNEVLPAGAVLKSATVDNSKLLMKEGEIGVVKSGAIADLLIIDGDPMADLSVLGDTARLRAVVSRGRFAVGALSLFEEH